jgi:hypothetical protein
MGLEEEVALRRVLRIADQLGIGQEQGIGPDKP